jgi:hypothetical protein
VKCLFCFPDSCQSALSAQSADTLHGLLIFFGWLNIAKLAAATYS